MLKYIGNGNFLAGVPARDLTDEEAQACGGKAALLASGLYLTPGAPLSPAGDIPPFSKTKMGGKTAKKESEL